MIAASAIGSRTSRRVKILNGVRMQSSNFTAGPPSKAINIFKTTDDFGTESYLVLAIICGVMPSPFSWGTFEEGGRRIV